MRIIPYLDTELTKIKPEYRTDGSVIDDNFDFVIVNLSLSVPSLFS